MAYATAKERILDASARLFIINGYKKTTTKLIAQEARVNEVTIFRLFGSKEGIVQEIVKSKLPYLRSIQMYFESQAAFDLEKDLIKAGDLYYEVVSNNIEMIMVLSHEMGTAFHQAFSIIPTELKATLIRYFTKMQKDKKAIVIDPEILAISFISSNIGFAMVNKVFNNGFIKVTSEEFIKQNIRAFVRGISP